MFLPTTREEVLHLGWDALDVILITGDSYIDSPFIGVAVIGKVLLSAGYRVGIIAQPDLTVEDDIKRLGEAKLFWGVTGGCIDSMVANRTASGRKRKNDDYTPGGRNNKRPDRAVIAYCNLIRKYFKQTSPIVLGGIEASLRRITHYDFWSNKIRKSILFDAKADYLLFGMAEHSVLELAAALSVENDPRTIRGLCYASTDKPQDALELPTFSECSTDTVAFTKMFHVFYQNNDPLTARTLAQRHDSRYLIQNPPAFPLSSVELDRIHGLDYERDVHPFYGKEGNIKALETIRFAILTHRGCYGECNFCAIAIHQGRTVRWRSQESILEEAKQLTRHPLFKGIIQDVGGPTANMYGFECSKKMKQGSCLKKRCLFPKVCPSLAINHQPQILLLKALRAINKIRKVFVASGIRYDLILADRKHGTEYLEELVRHHISGQMKLAPEHCSLPVLEKMGKPGTDCLLEFKELFQKLTDKAGKKQFLTYYMIAAHPGCTLQEMRELKNFSLTRLKLLPKQVQVFTPTPSTYSTLMYYTKKDPFDGTACFVETSFQGREKQKNILTEEKKSKFRIHSR